MLERRQAGYNLSMLKMATTHAIRGCCLVAPGDRRFQKCLTPHALVEHASVIPCRTQRFWRQKHFARRKGRQKFLCGCSQVVEAAVVETVKSSSFQQLVNGTKRRYVMISGKGGVGKTSLAASLACQLAAEGHTTLVVSTDPAHSLSDSFDQDVSGGRPVQIEGTDLPVWAMEIDADEAKNKFAASPQEGKAEGTSEFLKGVGLGFIADQVADLKLGELLETPPPGLDEAVAIAKVVEFVKSEEYARFSRIIFDTAPTGHTLRLLTAPDFAEASLSKIIRLRRQLGGAGTALRSLFQASEQQDAAVAKLEKLKESVIMVGELFRNKDANELIIATIPTVLAVKESARLLKALQAEEIPCNRIVVNQVIDPALGTAFLKRKLGDQHKAMQMVQRDPDLQNLRRLQSPLVDLEVRGVPALQYFGSKVWSSVLDEFLSAKSRQFYLLGGKGGVGKTSTAAALGLMLAQAGKRTLVVSTDPAHSLSDSLDQDVSGGAPVVVEGTDAQMYGMEVDIGVAKEELRDLITNDPNNRADSFLKTIGLGALAGQLNDLKLGELLETMPPGVDEAVAISKVVQLAKTRDFQDFSHIIFDTAPTGHTIRLLTLPDFLDATLGKIVRLRQKFVDAADRVKGLFGAKKEQDSAVAKLEALRARTEAARDLFRDASSTQFIIVCVPTVLAVAESARLAKVLKAEAVPLKTLVINQVVEDSAAEKFIELRRNDQLGALRLLKEDPLLRELEVTQAPLLDLEVRGVPALLYFGKQVWH